MRIARALVAGRPTFGEVDGERFVPLEGDVFGEPRPSGEALERGGLTPLSPTDPHRLFAVLGGFHPPEGPPEGPRPDPLLVPKVVPAVGGDGAEIVFPSFCRTVMAEAELAVVVGRPLRGASPEEAAEGVFGYTCCNDVTAPELFPQFYLSKSIDTFATLGPWVVTDVDPADIRAGLAIVCRVNGERVQEGTTRRYKFAPEEVLSYLSRFLTLSPGDVVTLGTPDAPPEVRPGDVVEVEVEGVGVLTNRVVEDKDGPAAGS
ncbi:MAG TPA: fumarylacetoacetate hydrolase family protein [Acidimicrobiales bacterium]|nr:fumarylacetoacetate hydrolase family protein [Acidimicrobiales bacterium]